MSLSVFQAFTKAMLSGTDSWKSYVADDVTLIGPIGTFQGIKEFVEVNTPFFASIQNHKVNRIIESGEWVLTQISVEVKLPSGKTVTLEVAEWYEIRGGKIQYLRTYFDPTAYMAGLQEG